MSGMLSTTSSRAGAFGSRGGHHQAGRETEFPWTLAVLTVDDDVADSSLIVEALRRNPHVREATAASAPEQALFQLAEGLLRPDLILLDIHMPRVNGFTFLRALRQAPWLARLPVVLLTTSGYAQDVERAQESDVLSYIVKPDTFDELRVRIDTVIRQMVVGD